MIFHILHNGYDTVAHAPKIPARLCVSLESLDQPAATVRIDSEVSSNGKWGKTASWNQTEITTLALESACFTLLRSVHALYAGIGLEHPSTIGFDYDVRLRGVDRIMFAFPQGPASIIDKDFRGAGDREIRSWPESRLRGQDRHCVINGWTTPTTTKNQGLKFAIVQLLKMGIRLLAAMRMKITPNWIDFDTVIPARAEKRQNHAAARSALPGVGHNLPRLDEMYRLADFVQTFLVSVGLDSPSHFSFDYQGNRSLPGCDMRRLTLRAPLEIDDYDSPDSLEQTCWRLRFSAYKSGIRPEGGDTDKNPDKFKAVRLATNSLRRAKYVIAACLNVPGDIESSDLARIIAERAKPYAKRVPA